MREPKFSDAPCYGKEFDATSKICRVCLANKSCQRKYYKALGAGSSETVVQFVKTVAGRPLLTQAVVPLAAHSWAGSRLQKPLI